MVVGLTAGVALVVPGSIGAQAPRPVTRLAQDEPEIFLTAGGRTGVCDAVRFSADGTKLYAVGEDKVVHVWGVGENRLTPAEPLRWNTFRERRGAIYALALLNDPDRPRLAVAGFGKTTADVALFDPTTGALVAALSPMLDPAYKAVHAVWALGFRPDGRELAVGDDGGNVWVWALDAAAGKRVRRAVVGAGGVEHSSRVVWVGYLPDGRLAFAKRDGGVYLADGDALFRFGGGAVDQVTASGDGRWLAARPSAETATGSRVEVRSLPNGDAMKAVGFDRGHFPDLFALDQTGVRLAVGIADFTKGNAGGAKTPFAVEAPGEVAVYDLRPATPARTARVTGLDIRPDALAFHPGGRRLAVAGGTDHATALYEIDGDRLKEVAADHGRARSLWGIGMSKDGRRLFFRDHHNPNPSDPNDRGTGPWVGFDLEAGDWTNARPDPVPPEDTRGGWKVDAASDAVWYAVEPGGARYKLPLDPLRDDVPRCYTFLPPAKAGGPVRLAVGHLWGVSVFELTAGDAPKRVRRLVGHAGYVTAIAPALGGTGLVTCGRDQVVALWGLADFPSQPVLGAAFTDEGGKLVVAAVDTGSPAEEAGLSKGDEVTRLFLGGDPRGVPRADWAATLAAAEPGVELAFYLRREGLPGQLPAKTALLHRPAARFFSTRDGEWVNYTYRQCYYACSANGDGLLTWVVSGDRADAAPETFPVARFRLLNRPDKVAAVVGRLTREPCKPVVDQFPPEVVVRAPKAVAGQAETEVEVVVTPRPRQDGQVNPIDKVELWVNGHYRAGLKPTAGEKVAAGKPFPVMFTVPAAALRVGTNELRAVAVARDAGVGESAPVRLAGPATGKERHLYGVVAGINQYDPFGARFNLKCAVRDARSIYEGWVGRFAGPDATTRSLTADKLTLLTDENVTRQAVFAAIDKAKAAGPDDLFVMFLAGHGLLGKDVGGSDEWYYAIPRSADAALTPADLAKKTDRLRSAFLRDEHLFDALAGLRCQTVVILDCCHSGAVSRALGGVAMTTQVRSLRPYGYGPVVIAACSPAERSWEFEGQGYFTRRVVRALGADFAAADADRDGHLSAAELFRFVHDGVRDDVQGVEDRDGNQIQQTPQIVPSAEKLRELILAEPHVRK